MDTDIIIGVLGAVLLLVNTGIILRKVLRKNNTI